MAYSHAVTPRTIFKREVLRYPRLDTVLMIEDAARRAKSEKTLTQLWKSLPKKVMWQTFTAAIDYLVYSGKILIDEKDHHRVIWTWNPRLLERVMREGVEA